MDETFKHFEILSFVAVLKFMVFMVVFILCFRLNKNQFPESVKKLKIDEKRQKMFCLNEFDCPFINMEQFHSE